MQNNVLLKMDLVYCLKHNSKKLMYFHDSSELPFVRLPDLIVSEFRNQKITILFFAEDIKYLGEWKAGVFFLKWGRLLWENEISCLTWKGLKFVVSGVTYCWMTTGLGDSCMLWYFWQACVAPKQQDERKKQFSS